MGLYLEINKKDLKNVLSIASKIVDTSSHNLLTQTIHIECNKEKNETSFIFFNNEIKIKYTINENITITNSGKILIKTKFFENIVSKLKEEKIILEEVDSNVMTIKQKDLIYNINTIDPELFNTFVFDIDWQKKFTVNLEEFKKCFNKCLHCIPAKTETNIIEIYGMILTGMNVITNKEQNILEMRGSDSARMALNKMKCNTNEDLNFVISASILNFIDILTDKNQETTFYISPNEQSIYFKINDNIEVNSNLLIGAYPNLDKILIKNETENVFTLNAKEFSDAIERVMILTDNQSTFPIQLSFKDDSLSLSTNSLELGHSNEKINMISNSFNSNYTVKVNSKYLLSILKAFNNTDVTLYAINTGIQRILFEGKNDQNFIQMLAPLR